MKTEWLEDFLVLAEEGNFSRAAERRHTAQPAFSRRIRTLENWAGAPLFARDHQPIELTPAGRFLEPIAADVTRQLRMGRERIRQAAAGENTLHFASTHTLSILFFPDWLHGIQGLPDGLGLNLQANHMDSCARALVQGDCQFMLCFTNPDADLGFAEDRYASKVIGNDFLVPYAAADEDGNPRFRLPGRAGSPVPHLIYSAPSALGRMVEASLARRTEALHIVPHSQSPAAENLKSMAEDGFGVAWVASMRVRRTTSAKPLAQAGDDSWRIPVDIRLFRAAGPLPDVAEDFWNLIEF